MPKEARPGTKTKQYQIGLGREDIDMSRLEHATLTLWESSLAIRGFTPFVNGQTFASMVNILKPLEVQGEWYKIRAQAEELLDMLVHDRQSRMEFRAGEVVAFSTGYSSTNPCSEIILSNYA